MSEKKQPDQQSQLTLRRLIAAAYHNFQTGIRQLRTPKGLVAVAPLVVSIAAYVKASVVTDELYLIMPSAIKITLQTKDGGLQMPPEPEIPAFFSKSGAATLYISKLTFNLQRHNREGAFDENCVYQHPNRKKPGEEASTRIYYPYQLVPRVMNKNYPYLLPQGFLVEANQFVPIDLTLVKPGDDPIRDEQISKALGATKLSMPWTFDTMELVWDRGWYRHKLTMCISATVVQPGEPARTVSKVFSSADGTLDTTYGKSDLGKIPVAPGGQDPGRTIVYTLRVRGSGLDKGILLYRSWKLHLF